MEIADRIRAARAAKGWTQRYLAHRMGLSEAWGYLQVSNWENGHKRPDLDSLASLASALGVSTDYLVYGENER